VARKRITLYEKSVHFISRHLAMERLTREITRGKAADTEKAEAIQAWVAEKVLLQEAAGALPVIDDHPHFIVVRGYGTREQRADLFSILCGYAGIPAGMYRLVHPRSRKVMVLAIARLSGRFYLFDPGSDNRFLTRTGNLASLEDLMRDSAPVTRVKNQPVLEGIPYAEYFLGLHPVSRFRRFLRADLQKPIPRFLYLSGRLLGWVEPSVLYY
jgi:hypothetical protein